MAVRRRSRPAGSFVWVLGSRSCPSSFVPVVRRCVLGFARSGLGVGAGGAAGPDSWALAALVSALSSLPAAVAARVRGSSAVSLAWASVSGAPLAARPSLSAALAAGVPFWWGSVSGAVPRSVAAAALLGRSRRLARCGRLVGVVCFCGSSLGAGSFFSLSLACRRVPVFVFCSPGCVLPSLPGGGSWVPASLFGCSCWRWVRRR